MRSACLIPMGGESTGWTYTCGGCSTGGVDIPRLRSFRRSTSCTVILMSNWAWNTCWILRLIGSQTCRVTRMLALLNYLPRELHIRRLISIPRCPIIIIHKTWPYRFPLGHLSPWTLDWVQISHGLECFLTQPSSIRVLSGKLPTLGP